MDRFSKVKTIPGKQGFHHFIPLSNDSIGAKRINFDKKFSCVYDFKWINPPVDSKNAKKRNWQNLVNLYFTLFYDWWLYSTRMR